MPLKKSRVESTSPASPVTDSPRKSSLRLKPQTQTQIQTNPVRMSPRKTSQPPSTPTRGQTRAETHKRATKVQHSKKDGTGVKREDDVCKNKASKTQVV